MSVVRRRPQTLKIEATMKLAEALALRKDIQTRISQLETRLRSNVRIQEGDQPMEAPEKLFEELDRCLKELKTLIYRINLTNMRTIVEQRPLTEWMAERDVLKMRLSTLRSVFGKISEPVDRFSRTEIKQVNTIDAKALLHDIDTRSKELRELDIRIQAANFTTELLDN